MAYSTISKPSLHFNTHLYTGDGQNSRAVTGVGFQPDFLWLKNRTTAYSNQTFDAVRGATAGTLYTDLTNAADTSYPITSFDSDGFTLRPTSHDSQNANGSNYVSWNWKANGAGSSNTDGSITSTVSANQTAGFSIVKWNGQTGTVGHGLGVKPSFIVVKCISIANAWVGVHKSLGANMNDNYVILNTSAAAGSTTWGGEPTSSVFSINANVAENNNNIAYCFAEKKGFSNFGTYIGNGQTDNSGPFIYTGFKPGWVMIRRTNTTGDWAIFDNKRNPHNVTNTVMYANYNSEDDTNTNNNEIDLLSNGFKIREDNNAINANDATYIYLAFAAEPLVANVGASIPATAR